MDYLVDVRRFHAEAVEPFLGPPVGCPPAEVDALERRVGFALPEAHRQFLLWMGRDYGGVFRGCGWFIDHIPGSTDLLPGLLARNSVAFRLPEHYLAFFSHQGYMAAWYALPKQGEDPLSWFFNEGGREGVEGPALEGRFTDVLLNDMRGLAAVLPLLSARGMLGQYAESDAAPDRRGG